MINRQLVRDIMLSLIGGLIFTIGFYMGMARKQAENLKELKQLEQRLDSINFNLNQGIKYQPHE